MKKDKKTEDFKYYKNFNFSSFDFNLDTPIFRYFPLKYLKLMLQKKELYLMPVDKWEDVYENWLVSSKERELLKEQRENFPRAFGQCWTLEEESDAMWRIYSNIEKHKEGADDDFDCSAIRVKTTPRELLEQILKNEGFGTNTLISPVKYLDREKFIEKRNSIIELFKSDPQKAIADSFFIKRNPFEHEKEVRIIVLDDKPYQFLTPLITPNKLFGEFVIDPRISRADYYTVRQSLLDLEVPEAKIRQSELYQLKPYPNVVYSNTKPETKEILQEIIRMHMVRDGFNCDLNDINVEQLTDLSHLFENKDSNDILSKFNGNIGIWDVSKVKDMSFMFSNSQFNGDVSNWDVSKVKDMSFMFSNSQFNGDVSNWDVSKVENMSSMFDHSQFNGDLSNWNVGNVKDMSWMFCGSIFDRDISNWDVGNVKDMKRMFDSSKFNSDISIWDMSNVENMSGMFDFSLFNKDISNWNVSNVRDMSKMFAWSKFNRNISNWNVSRVENMQRMFYKSPFKKDVSNWNTSKVKDMSWMFYNTQFNGDISNWDVSRVINMKGCFCKSQFNGDISNWDVSMVENMEWMFCDSQFNGDISDWDVGKVRDMHDMFTGSKFNGDISRWKVKPEDCVRKQI